MFYCTPNGRARTDDDRLSNAQMHLEYAVNPRAHERNPWPATQRFVPGGYRKCTDLRLLRGLPEERAQPGGEHA